jgi:hypothetical protein
LTLLPEAVTHLVIEPKHRQGPGLLVPLDLIDATAGGIELRGILAEFGKLDSAEEAQFLPGSTEYADYGPGQAISWPCYGLAGTGTGTDPRDRHVTHVLLQGSGPAARGHRRPGREHRQAGRARMTDQDAGRAPGPTRQPQRTNSSLRLIRRFLAAGGHCRRRGCGLAWR